MILRRVKSPKTLKIKNKKMEHSTNSYHECNRQMNKECKKLRRGKSKMKRGSDKNKDMPNSSIEKLQKDR